jgi:hypothetical protein
VYGYVTNPSDSGETFHLKSFLEDSKNSPSQFPWGQCSDFADFLACLSNSVGALTLKAQRTNSFFEPGFTHNTI